ncbi:MAG: glycosyltransferase family 4 protein [Bacteroidales bacterium]|nr:glycosyltransferase family 4 protein [Bacteroidales bacterium]
MQNILLLTNIYPAPDLEKENTPVVHYFAREWVKMGYNVRVIHYPANFPKLYLWFGAIFRRVLSSRLGVPIRAIQAKEKIYQIEEVKVKRIPLMKYRLHGAFPRADIDRAYQKTLNYLSHEAFRPDVIVSHWVNPQLEIMERLKREFDVPSCYVAHTPTGELTHLYDDCRIREIINGIDLIGFRSRFIQETFVSRFSYSGPTFSCNSGIPEQYIPVNPSERLFEKIHRFIFVGMLIKRKYPAEIVSSLVKAFGNKDFEIDYIGVGAEDRRIKGNARKYGVEEKVHLLGRLPREEVVDHLRQSDVFVMNSSSEAFGLVYLEAMAQGCLTIASANEGFDGIIKDGENGFLCRAGDVDDLSLTIGRILRLQPSERRRISANAMATAQDLTDVNVASAYLNELKSICNRYVYCKKR